MNIWYFSAYDQPRGQSSRTYDFAKILVKKGHKVTFFTNSYCHFTHVEKLVQGEKWRIETIDGIRVVWLSTFHYVDNGWRRGVNMLSNVIRSQQVARLFNENPDVVIGPSVPLFTGWSAYRIAKKRNASFIFEIRDVWPIALIDNGALSPYHPLCILFRYLEKKLYKHSDSICSVLPYVSQHIASCGCDPAKVVWIPNGIDLTMFPKSQDEVSDERAGIRVMYVGGFCEGHGVINIIKAASIMQERGYDDFRFILIGDGVKKAECRGEALKCELHNIEFRETIPKSKIPMEQSTADLLIACITGSDVYRFGVNLNKVYGYFASSKPIVFSGEVPNDYVESCGAGFSVPPEDPEAIVEALLKFRATSAEQRIEMGANGRRFVELEFDINILASRMEQLLLKCLADKGDGYAA